MATTSKLVAIAKTDRRPANATPVCIDGVNYHSVAAAAFDLNLSETSIHKRAASPAEMWEEYEYIDLPPDELAKLNFKDILAKRVVTEEKIDLDPKVISNCRPKDFPNTPDQPRTALTGFIF